MFDDVLVSGSAILPNPGPVSAEISVNKATIHYRCFIPTLVNNIVNSFSHYDSKRECTFARINLPITGPAQNTFQNVQFINFATLLLQSSAFNRFTSKLFRIYA